MYSYFNEGIWNCWEWTFIRGSSVINILIRIIIFNNNNNYKRILCRVPPRFSVIHTLYADCIIKHTFCLIVNERQCCWVDIPTHALFSNGPSDRATYTDHTRLSPRIACVFRKHNLHSFSLAHWSFSRSFIFCWVIIFFLLAWIDLSL